MYILADRDAKAHQRAADRQQELKNTMQWYERTLTNIGRFSADDTAAQLQALMEKHAATKAQSERNRIELEAEQLQIDALS